MPGTAPPLQAPNPVGVPAGGMAQSPQIKTEPGVAAPPNLPPMNNVVPANSPNPQSARERAANMLHQRFGAAAANSVSQLQAQSMGIPGQPRPQGMPPVSNGQGPQIKQEPGYPPMPQPPVNNSQTDGGGDDALSDWKAEVARRREAAERQGGAGDRVLRDHIKANMLRFEGGGLMLPLDEQQSAPKASTRAVASASSAEPVDSTSNPASSGEASKAPRPQFDGPGGDDEKEEDDEDAINSDLDDPDDLVAEDHDAEDSVGQVMLCTYDKVQRVKNKWKCTLKDGILTTGGKE